MTTSGKSLITSLYGAWLAAAGIWRFIEAGSKPALGFGMTTGLMALTGAILLRKGNQTAAKVLIVVTLLFVVGFFITKSAKEGLDVRVGITLLSSVIEAIVLFMPVKDDAKA